MPTDGLIAVSETGATKLVRSLLSAQHIVRSGSGSWGPFIASYNVDLRPSGGRIELVDPPRPGDRGIVRVSNVNVAGSVGLSVGFDLNRVLPRICIPPVRVCVKIPFLGEVCTPQVCISFPTLSVGVTLPISVNLGVDFSPAIRRQGQQFAVQLDIFPLSVTIDLSPMVGLLLDAVRRRVSSALQSIPLIGGLLAGLVNIVIGALSSVLSIMFHAISGFVHDVILLLDFFSPTIPVTLLKVDAVQRVLSASGATDPEVDLTIDSLNADIQSRELLLSASFQ